MRLYSNKLLSWPQIIHAFQAGRLYSGRWQNYYFYRVSRIQPIVITTHSPLEFLQENNQYYCYDKYIRNKNLEEFENIRESVTLHNQEMDYNENWIYVPKFVAAEDIIVIHNDLARGYPSVTSKYYYQSPLLMLV